MSRIWKGLGKAAIAVATLLGAQAAHAQSAGTSNGTTADTTVTNSVAVNYSINSVGQTQVNSSVSFKVDRKVNLVVKEVGTTDTQVVPGATAQVTAFTVLNASNSAIDIALAAAFDLTTGPRGNTASFTATNVKIYIDGAANGAGANGTFESGSDTNITANPYLDEVEVTADGDASKGIRTVFVVVDIPGGATNGQVEVVSLTGEARFAGTASTLGGVFTNNSGDLDDPNVVQNVFADGAGPATGDAATDGKHSDDDAYVVNVTALTVTKSVKTISHDIGGGAVNTNPKAIPGAVLEYCLFLNNTGSNAAETVVAADALPAQVTYETGTLLSGTTCNDAALSEDDDDVGLDDTTGTGASYAAGNTTVTVKVNPSIAAGASVAVKFRVKVK